MLCPLRRLVTKSRRNRLPGCVALTVALLPAAAAAAGAQPVQPQVLLLQSVDRGNLVIDNFTTNFHVELDQRAGLPVNFIQFVVGPIGAVGASERAAVGFIAATFRDGPKPDLIVSVGGPASAFARKYRQQLFPDTPLLFTAVDQRYLDDAPLEQNEAAVAVNNDFPGLVDDILLVLPRTRHVFVVTGSGLFSKFWRPRLEEQFKRFQDRLTFAWFDDLSFPEILRRSARLPNDSAILYVTFGTDAAGAAYADERVVTNLHDSANAPLFAPCSVYLGAGSVGGSLLAVDELSRHTAEAAVRLLNGAAPTSIKVPLQRPGQPVYDSRELQRWGIPESRLPPGSVVRYRTPSLWSAYRATLLSALGVLTVQSLLIAGLLYQRRARRRAEIDSRRHLALAADASRRATMSALTTSIGHELGQPLSAMIHNAQAGRRMITANRLAADTLDEIFSDIESEGVQATQIIDRHRVMLRNHQLETRSLNLHDVIQQSLALVAHDMKAREIEATLNLSSNPCIMTGDDVLLQQVLVNLLVNAMDAMAGTPPARRRVTISTEVSPAAVAVSVRDAGTGLPAELDGTLFMPFVTTKAHGLGIGLTITQMIVDVHGGTLNAHNNPDGGATLSVTLPRSEPPRDVPGPSSAA
jgi:signal transduction histidine kinase